MLKSKLSIFVIGFLFFFRSPVIAENSVDSTNYYTQVCDSFANKSQEFQPKLEKFEKAINWFNHVNNKIKSAHCHVVLGDYFFGLELNDSACKHYQKGIDILLREHKTDTLAIIYNKLASCEYYRGNFGYAKQEFTEGMKYQMSKSTEATFYTGLAMSCEGLDLYDTAIALYGKALSLYQELNDSLGIAYSNINIGSLYIQREELKQGAKDYLLPAYKYLKKVDDKKGLAAAINNLAVFYNKSKDYDKELASYKEVYTIDSALNNRRGLSGDLNNIGQVYANKKDTANAYKSMYKALTIAKELQSKQMISYSAYNLAFLMLNLDSLDRAITFAKISLKAGTDSGSKSDELSALELLSEIYLKVGDYKNAYTYLNNYITLYDSAFSVEKAQLLANAKERFEAVQKQNKILSLEQKNLKETNIKNILFITTILVSIMLIIIVVTFLFVYKSRKQISRQKQYFSKLLANSIEYKFVVGENHLLKYVSPSYKHMFFGKVGDKIEESFFRSLSEKDILMCQEQFMALRKGKRAIPFNFKIKDFRGEEKYVTGKAQIFLNDDLINGVIVNLWDITDLKETSEALIKREKELEVSNETKEKLFSIISHDLLSHVGISFELAKMLNDEYEELDFKLTRKIITSVANSLETTNTLVVNLLSWARIQMNKMLINRETVLLFPIIERSIGLYEDQLKEKSIKSHVTCDRIIKVNADPNQLEIIFRNLLRNAIKFTHTGGNIWLECKVEKSVVNICIRDDGVGMDSNQVKFLFNNSSKIESTYGTNKEKGTGLGMLIVKEFVHLNKGKLRINSKPKEGTEICITLLP